MIPTNHSRLKPQHGYILLPVVFTLIVIATLSYLLSQQSAVDTGAANREQQMQAAKYAAEAGLQHALWQYNQDECTGYTDLNNVAMGSNSYSVTVTPTSGSPISIIATGIHANGAKYRILRDQVRVYQKPSILVLQPDAVNGKDAYLWYPGTSDNYGSDKETWVSTMSNDKTVALHQFDLGTVPAGSKVKILSAILSLHHWQGWDSNVPVSAHRITNSWNETEVSWDNRTSTLAWDTPAGDFDPEIIDTTLVGPTSNIRYEWQLKSVVEKWLSGSQPNYGVLLRTTAPNIDGERFYTSDDNDSTKHPRLTITYACECDVNCIEVSTLNALADTYIYQNSSGTNYGSVSQVLTGEDNAGSGKKYRSLLQFDISTIPVGATVISATLRLYQESSGGSGSVNMDVHKITASWVENSITWSSSGGGSYDTTDLVVASVDLGTSGWVEWNLPIDLIHDWIDAVSPNYGVLVNYNGQKNKWANFVSREHINSTQQPQLVIEYTMP